MQIIERQTSLIPSMVERARETINVSIKSGRVIGSTQSGRLLTGSADVSSGRAWELADQNALAEQSFG